MDTETYSEDDPWRRVPRRNKVTVTFKNMEALRAERPMLENETCVSLWETAKAIRKQQLFYLGQLLSDNLAGEWDAPDPVALKAAMLDNNRDNENTCTFSAGKAVVLGVLQHLAGTRPAPVHLQDGADAKRPRGSAMRLCLKRMT